MLESCEYLKFTKVVRREIRTRQALCKRLHFAAAQLQPQPHFLLSTTTFTLHDHDRPR